MRLILTCPYRAREVLVLELCDPRSRSETPSACHLVDVLVQAGSPQRAQLTGRPANVDDGSGESVGANSTVFTVQQAYVSLLAN